MGKPSTRISKIADIRATDRRYLEITSNPKKKNVVKSKIEANPDETGAKFLAVQLVHVPHHVVVRFGKRWWTRIGESNVRRLDTGVMASIPMNTLVAVKKRDFPVAKLNLTRPLN